MLVIVSEGVMEVLEGDEVVVRVDVDEDGGWVEVDGKEELVREKVSLGEEVGIEIEVSLWKVVDGVARDRDEVVVEVGELRPPYVQGPVPRGI